MQLLLELLSSVSTEEEVISSIGCWLWFSVSDEEALGLPIVAEVLVLVLVLGETLGDIEGRARVIVSLLLGVNAAAAAAFGFRCTELLEGCCAAKDTSLKNDMMITTARAKSSSLDPRLLLSSIYNKNKSVSSSYLS